MPIDCLIKTHHSVEFTRGEGRVVKRAQYLLEVPVTLPTPAKKDLKEAFVCVRHRHRTVLYGYAGGLWRESSGVEKPEFRFEASLDDGVLSLDTSIAPEMRLPLHTGSGPMTLHPFAPNDTIKIVSDDKPVMIAAAQAAAKRAMVVDGRLWVRVRDPEWLVSKADNGSDLKLLLDVHVDWMPHKTKDFMRFRLDRFPQAVAWGKGLRGSKIPPVAGDMSWTEIEEAIVAGPWGVRRADFSFLAEDDLLNFARPHLGKVVALCADVIEALPSPLRRRWEEIRIAMDGIGGPAGKESAIAGLAMVEGTLDMLTEVRNIPPEKRSSLMRQIVRLRQANRRTEAIEGISPAESVAPVEEEDLAGLSI